MQRCGPAGLCDECAANPGESHSDQMVQRQPDAGTKQAGPSDAGAPDAGPTDAGKTDAGGAGAPGPSITYVTVRDPSIGMGGQVVPDLNAVKTRIMAKQQTGDWTLVLAIHGSEGRLAAQSPPDWQKDAQFYGPADIAKLFGGDGAFVTWRDKFGPRRVVLLGCQVGAPFEQVVANNLTRGGSGLTAQGLGSHCKPITRTEPLLWGPPGKETAVRTRADFDRLDEAGKQWITEQLTKWNERWGYLGMSPVPNGELLRYFFEEEPKGAWAIVEVNKDVNGTLTPLGVPYHNRMGNSAFLQNCNMGVGTLKPRETN